ncbi:hypothetical protein D9M71_650980 [compost metagenome]
MHFYLAMRCRARLAEAQWLTVDDDDQMSVAQVRQLMQDAFFQYTGAYPVGSRATRYWGQARIRHGETPGLRCGIHRRRVDGKPGADA